MEDTYLEVHGVKCKLLKICYRFWSNELHQLVKDWFSRASRSTEHFSWNINVLLLIQWVMKLTSLTEHYWSSRKHISPVLSDVEKGHKQWTNVTNAIPNGIAIIRLSLVIGLLTYVSCTSDWKKKCFRLTCVLLSNSTLLFSWQNSPALTLYLSNQ